MLLILRRTGSTVFRGVDGEMPSAARRYVYGMGKDGFQLLERGTVADEDSVSTFVAFCRKLSWRPAKGGRPEERCVAVVPAGKGMWICVIGDSGSDSYGRGLSIRVVGCWVAKNNRTGDAAQLVARIREVAAEHGLSLADGEVEKVIAAAEGPLIIGDRSLLRVSGRCVFISPGGAASFRPGREMGPPAESAVSVANVEKTEKTDNTSEAPVSRLDRARPAGAGEARGISSSSDWKGTVVGFVVGVGLGAIGMWWWGLREAIARNEEMLRTLDGMREVLRETFVLDDEVDPGSIQRAYEKWCARRDVLQREVGTWRHTAGRLFPHANSPRALESSVRELEDRLESARQGLSDEDRRASEILEARDGLVGAALKMERAAKELRLLLEPR